MKANLRRCFAAAFFSTVWLFSIGASFAQPTILPPLPPNPDGEKRLSSALTIFVREFRFEGNTVFPSNELARVIASYTDRKIDSGELEDARRALTKFYVDHGYINSGAVLEDQAVTSGVITFRIVEGKLSEVEVTGNRWLRSSFIRSRLERYAGTPLNFNQLREGLLLLRENPNVRRINAVLLPGAVPGESKLDVSATDQQPFHLGFQMRNDRPPSVGAEVIEVLATDQSLTGHSDLLELRYGVAQRTPNELRLSSLDNLGVSYNLPLTQSETSLQLGYDRGDFTIVEEPFNLLDIASKSDVLSIGVRQPLYKRIDREFTVSIVGDRRRSQSFLLGERFSFSPGAVDGETVASVLRFVQEYVQRNQSQVIVFRSSINWGVDVLGATRHPSGRDGTFASWLGQAQFVRRLWDSPCQVIVNATCQWTDDPLPSVEQFSLGGAGTVRGYRENQLVRDAGLLTTLEFRVPVLFSRRGASVVELAPFLDYGAGWNNGGPTPKPSELLSVGIGLLFHPTPKIHAQLYWGHGFREFKHTGGMDAQDLGLHFRVVAWAF